MCVLAGIQVSAGSSYDVWQPRFHQL